MIEPSAEATTPRDVRRVAELRVARASGWWGMLMLIATESALFGTLIASFFYLRFRAVEWPPPGASEPKVVVPLVLTAVLVATSAPMALASWAAAQGRLWSARLALFAALFVGSGYLGMQIHRYLESLETFTPQESAYASIVYVLSGGHHAHVALGLLLNVFLLVRLAGGLTAYRLVAVQSVALYWHFVNVLAVAVTATLLSPAV